LYRYRHRDDERPGSTNRNMDNREENALRENSLGGVTVLRNQEEVQDVKSDNGTSKGAFIGRSRWGHRHNTFIRCTKFLQTKVKKGKVVPCLTN
jgi:hypothetical protein